MENHSYQNNHHHQFQTVPALSNEQLQINNNLQASISQLLNNNLSPASFQALNQLSTSLHGAESLAFNQTMSGFQKDYIKFDQLNDKNY